jgi:hypothetical protein
MWALGPVGEHVVQPTVPSQECVGCTNLRAEEGTFSWQSKSSRAGRPAIRMISKQTTLRRVLALLTSLSALVTLALAGGAGVKGW